MNMNLKLKKFDMAKLGFTKKRNNNSMLGSKVLILGKRATGKTYLVQDILQHYQDVPKVTVFVHETDNADANSYKEIISESRIFSYNLQSVLDENKTVEKDAADSSMDTRRIVVADSCVYGRHHILSLPETENTMYILAEQYPLGIPPIDKEKLDYVFILKENVINNLKRIYDNYAGIFPSFEAFCAVMDQCTRNYECLVIKKACFGDKIEDVVFWYKAAAHTPVHIG